uniref:(northern house mosquito) hypothetical protein n=1 Tax=Culex pipiens TaxID=7175 RepID=A0A8D8BZY1_CULPI
MALGIDQWRNETTSRQGRQTLRTGAVQRARLLHHRRGTRVFERRAASLPAGVGSVRDGVCTVRPQAEGVCDHHAEAARILHADVWRRNERRRGAEARQRGRFAVESSAEQGREAVDEGGRDCGGTRRGKPRGEEEKGRGAEGDDAAGARYSEASRESELDPGTAAEGAEGH